ncbi:MAG: DUF4838 domain-containing protein [Pirellulales bacterium]|nr:DUF4838 domain-containing protein [Pirellulales bacterium]
MCRFDHLRLVIACGVSLLALALQCASAGAADALRLVEQGQPVCSIVVSKSPTPAAQLAALELQFHVLKITGAQLPIRTDDSPTAGRRILVGDSAAAAELGFRGDDLAPQEYCVAFRPDTLVLIGRDWRPGDAATERKGRPMVGGDTLEQARHQINYWKTVGCTDRDAGNLQLPGLYDDQGTYLATCDFLERHCGVRWYGPGEIGAVIPERSTLTVAGDDVRRAPALKQRNALASGNWPFMKNQWGEVSPEQIQLHWRRLRLIGERWACNHTFHRQTVHSTFRDREYQCRNLRGYGSQLCYTNRKLIEQVAQMARDYFDGQGELPEGWKALGDYFALVPDDNSNFCQCQNCKALLAQGQKLKTGYFNSGEASVYWFTFVNEVAREVRKTHPDKYIATLGYWLYAIPPDFNLEPNVSIAPCLGTCAFSANPVVRDSDLELYQNWFPKTQAPMFMWVYFHHPMEPALIQGWKCFPNVMVHQTADNMRRFVGDKVRGIFVCGEQDQLEHYVMVKLWDNAELDVDQLLDEFFRLYFGAAAEPMKRFYLRLEQIACDPANYPASTRTKYSTDWRTVAWEHLGTAERVQELGALIAAAEGQVTTPRERQRVALWRHAFWDWIVAGREQYLAEQKLTKP